MTTPDFTDPPRARTSYRRNGKTPRHVPYVPQPTSSLDWWAADWEHPTALEFETKVMTLETYAAEVPIPQEGYVMHPTEWVDLLEMFWRHVRRGIESAGKVVDRDVRLGIGVASDGIYHRHADVLTFTAKCWPAIPGVTVPKKDVTW